LPSGAYILLKLKFVEDKMSKINLDASVAEFVNKLEKNGGKPLYELTPKEARQVLRDVQKVEKQEPAAKIEEIKVPLGDGRDMRVLLVKPADVGETLPVVFYIHGGGWVMGDETTHDRLIRQLATDIPAAVAFPVYELSPEAQYPQTTNDLFTALQYIAEYGAKYNLDTSRLAVAGDSVGGNMAAVMAIMAKENDFVPKIDFQLLFYPVTNAVLDTESYKTFADGPWLTQKAMEWFWQQYAPETDRRKEIYASPLSADIEDLQDLPPALVITAENDVLRDEGEAYARRLTEAGVLVGSIRVNGAIHDFLMLNDLADSVPAKAALALAVVSLQDIFEALPTDGESM